MTKALAYLNHGQWVADCPADGCTDARAVYHPTTGTRQTQDVCARGHAFGIVMPPPQFEAQITTYLRDNRVYDADRSWYPQGHLRAAAAGFPTGQSLDDLIGESAEVVEYRSAQEQARREQMRTALARFGVDVRPDGTFEGSLI